MAAERAAVLERYHLWADDPGAPAHLHADTAVSIWDASAASRGNVERLFAPEAPGLFGVVQSNAGLQASEVAAVAARHFLFRRLDRALAGAPGPLETGGAVSRVALGRTKVVSIEPCPPGDALVLAGDEMYGSE